MLIGGFQKTSLLDYPGKIAAIVFTRGCNFRCGYCHNPELIDSDMYTNASLTQFDEAFVFHYLEQRKGLIDAVVITGGEPCLQKDLIPFISNIKKIGYAVKLDTNGTSPNVIESCLKLQIVDYIAMDIKAPVEKYDVITNVENESQNILKSIKIIKESGIDYEFRTTVVKSLLNFEDFEKIGKLIEGTPAYYLQKFVPSKTLNPEFMEEETYSDEEFENIKTILNKYVKNIFLR